MRVFKVHYEYLQRKRFGVFLLISFFLLSFRLHRSMTSDVCGGLKRVNKKAKFASARCQKDSE